MSSRPSRNRSSALLSILFGWLFLAGLVSPPLHGSIPRDRHPTVELLALIEGPPAAERVASAFPTARLELGISDEDSAILRWVLVRQNPWSKFDPEGLQAADIGRNIASRDAAMRELMDDEDFSARTDRIRENGRAMARDVADAMDTAVSLTPQGAGSEVITGQNAKGEKLSWWQRGLSAIGIFPAGKATKLVYVGDSAMKTGVRTAAHMDEAFDMGRVGSRLQALKQNYWEYGGGGMSWDDAKAIVESHGFGFDRAARTSGSRFDRKLGAVKISPADMQKGMVNKVMLAEEIQHGLDGATSAAGRAIRQGKTNEQFHTEVFQRILDSHAGGGFQFLDKTDVSAMQKMIDDLK